MHNRTLCTPRTNYFLLAALLTGLVAVAVPAWGGQVINEDFKLLPSDGARGDRFGKIISVNNGVVAIGAYRDDNKNGLDSGSAYLFDMSTGAQICKLLPDDGMEDDEFGWSIAIDNGIVAVGAYLDDDVNVNSGSAYLFDASTGDQISKLRPSDGAAYDGFGWFIAMDDGIVAIGVPGDDVNGTDTGSAYLFEAITGDQIAKLVLDDREAVDLFGWSIAIDNGIVAVGAPGDDDNGFNSGSVYLFEAITGALITNLVPNDGAEGDMFGMSIAIDDGVVAIGAIRDDDNGDRSGSAYLFDVVTGAQIAKLLPSDGGAGDLFGNSIAIDDGVVAIGAIRDDDYGDQSGSAYLFDVVTGAQIAKLLPSDGGVGVQFGNSLAIDNAVVTVGAIGDDENGIQSGSSYVFEFSCLVDLTGNGMVDIEDFLVFLNYWTGGDALADWNWDGMIDTLDVLAYLNALEVGCP